MFCVDAGIIFLNVQYMTISVNYEKRKNQQLFQNLERMGYSKTQNYVPLYRNFFILNENNYSSVNLNHIQHIESIKKTLSDNTHVCVIKSKVGKPRNEMVFFKFAPLLDPVKYMIGKYTINDELMTLPSINTSVDLAHPKIVDPNNSSYVDGFFSYLSNQLLTSSKFVHGVRYYGSFLTIKKNFKLDVYDDLEYLIKSDFFNKNKGKLFKIDDYSELFEDETSCSNLPTIKIIDKTEGDAVNIEPETIETTDFGDVFVEDKDTTSNIQDVVDDTNVFDLLPLTVENIETHDNKGIDYKNSIEGTYQQSDAGSLKKVDTNSDTSEEENSEISYTDDEEDNEEDSKNTNSSCSDDESDESSESEDEEINAYFPEFPVQLICMEACENTLDQLIIDDEMNEKLWLSALMQIIMTLITYQKVFSFTHNDLHTNNVMYVSTKKKYLYYCFKGVYYKVPTYGKIFKIIDFGRAIYKHDGKIMCSDSFSPSGDAATQYNVEPYYNSNKPRLEPNYSFDLCRLACSIFDYLVDDMKDIRDLSKCDTITRLIVEWCIDDNGINMLYKNNGTDRYPDFKLYKMIARCVHKHTPQGQLERDEFKKFHIVKSEIPNSEPIMNIDDM